MAQFKSSLRNLSNNFLTHKVEITIEVDNDEEGSSLLKVIETYKNKELMCELKPYHKKRSLDANAYAWVLMDKLAQATGIPKTEIYIHYIKEVGGNAEVVCVKEDKAQKIIDGWNKIGLGWVCEKTTSKIDGCINLIMYEGTSAFDSATFSRLLDLIIQDCKEQDIQTATPEELRMIKENGNDTI